MKLQTKRLQLCVSSEMHGEIKNFAEQNSVTMASVIKQAVGRHLRENKFFTY